MWSRLHDSDNPAVDRRCQVWVWDQDRARQRAILDAVCGLPRVSVGVPSATHPDLLNVGVAGCIVCLADRSLSAADLKFVSAVRRALAFVICVIGDAPESRLTTSCRLLMAGATHVINCGDDDFGQQLRTVVQKSVDGALNSEAEERALQTLMSGAGFAGCSRDIYSLFRTLRNVSSFTELPVLITGETGTGKELLAAAIHSLDLKRSRYPFVSINCAALPEQLSESELFGHQRGAFTGAERERAGLFRSAEGGSLFLDEVGELSSSLQGKLLRVLQSGRLRSVGSDRETAVNVRVIAATHRNLDDMVRSGTFREDLFHRLNVLSLHIPPLRERVADIEPLVQHFIEKYPALWQAKGRPVVGRDFLHALEKSALPGNARQVENIVRRALLQWDGAGELSLVHLTPGIWRELSVSSEPQQDPELAQPQSFVRSESFEDQAVDYLRRHGWNLIDAIRYLETLLVRGALGAAGGNQSEAARLLGITPRSVYNKLRRCAS